MSFDEDEKLIGQLLESYELKKPPQTSLDGFETAVFKKLESGPRINVSVPVVAMSVALVLALAGAYLLWPKAQPQPSPTPEVIEKLQPTVEAPIMRSELTTKPPGEVVEKLVVEEATPEVVDEAEMDAMARELFILQMLGEDEGLLDVFETDFELEMLSVDLEFLPQTPQSVSVRA